MTAAALRWLDDAVNPIVVKELRQAVRGRFVVAMLILSLLVESIVIGVTVLMQDRATLASESFPKGPGAFSAIFMVLFIGSVFFIPMYSGLRMMAERSESEVDLLFITTIRPRSIVLGKLLASSTIALLLFSASLPFMMFCYVLRGIDFITILMISAIGFFIVVSQCVVALFVGSLPASKPFKFVLGIVLFIITLSICVPMFTVAAQFIRMGGAVFSTPTFLRGMTAFGVTILALDVVLLFLSTAIISPPTANRAFPIRVLLFVLWAGSFALAFWIGLRQSNLFAVRVWAWIEIAIGALVVLSATGEREEWGARIARTIPQSAAGRITAFLFYSGGGGVLWGMILMGLTIAAYSVADARIPSLVVRNSDHFTTFWLAEAALCLIAYAMTALFVRRRVSGDRIPPRATWAISLAMFIFGAVIPPIVCIMAFSSTPNFNRLFSIVTMANPFPMTDVPVRMTRTIFLSSWAVLSFLANTGWLKTLFARFRRPQPLPVPSPVVS